MPALIQSHLSVHETESKACSATACFLRGKTLPVGIVGSQEQEVDRLTKWTNQGLVRYLQLKC